jgi:hypothetical protein
MNFHIVCLGRAEPPALLRAGQGARAALPALRQVQVQRVLRHIPTDSVAPDQARQEIVPRAGEVQAVLACEFADEGARAEAMAMPAWSGFMDAVRAAGEPLLSFHTFANVPITPVRGAAEGGFRRWMLLRRAGPTREDFRDAWFGRHADLVKRLPQVDGYLQHLVTGRYDGRGRPLDYAGAQVDGIAELCFADEAAMQASYASEARIPLRDDGRELLGGIATLLVHGEAV